VANKRTTTATITLTVNNDDGSN